MKVQIFRGDSNDYMQNMINEWLEGKKIDIKFVSTNLTQDTLRFSGNGMGSDGGKYLA